MFTILIDGRSGAGKTTFAAGLARRTGYRLVHLDEFYPGWGGLAAAAGMVASQLLHPLTPGYTRWDWGTDTPGERVRLPVGQPLIIEGAGAVTAASISAAERLGGALTVRIDAPRELRRERALRRDPGYGPWWRMWAAQEDEHFAAHPGVDLVLRNTPR
ncbi:hypothetical protein [Corynebacterium halotolerans]|uniref:hypothetical protein n=1 Tax=Corynebacterium halotolerans TaxID=225326 RepID=UPI003CF25852